jgi:hypothetical protein
MAAQELVVESEAKERSARAVVGRGAVCSVASSLVVSVCLVAVVMLDGYTHLYSLVLIGVAAGGAMATQVPVGSRAGGLVSLLTTALFVALTIPAVATASTVQAEGLDREGAPAEITRAFEEVGGLAGSYLWMMDTGGMMVAAYAAAALVLGLACALLLGRRDQAS